MNKPPLFILTGPTAVGKTELSIQLAKAVNGEIISADSVQVYRGMNIGSAKITKEEMEGIPHYLIDILNPDEEFNVYHFKNLAKNAMSRIYRKGKVPIITGGTGFYIQSVLYNVQFPKALGNSNREYYEVLAEEYGMEFVYHLLKVIDPEYADTVHINNRHRVIHALDFYHQTGIRLSEHNRQQQENESPYDFHYFVLNRERSLLYQRINQRVDQMIEQGFVEEVAGLIADGYHRGLSSMQSLGYREIGAYLDGEMTLDEAVEKIKLNTRHFAKRQLTWFRREKDATILNYEDFQNDTQALLNRMLEAYDGPV